MVFINQNISEQEDLEFSDFLKKRKKRTMRSMDKKKPNELQKQ
jgi:hypothetical protein